MTRDERQEQCVQKWIRANHHATIEAFTGFGKTRIAMKIINLLRRNDRTRKVVIIVPTIHLKEQWESLLIENKQQQHTEVLVINSLILRKNVQCSLLILDEIHRYAAETFSLVFQIITYQFILGLTATLKRLDGKHSLLEKHAPICDVISKREATLNGWVSKIREYNLGIEMSATEREEYGSLKRQFQAMFDKFENDFELMKNCSFGAKPGFHQPTARYYEPTVVKYAKRMGWRGNDAVTAFSNYMQNQTRARGTKISVWGGDMNHPFHPDKLNGFAVNGMRLMRKMKEFVYHLESKVQIGYELITQLPYKIITFGEVVATAERLHEMLGDSAVIYHSKMKAKVVNGRKISGAQLKRDSIVSIKSNKVRIILTAKALDEGADFPDLECGIMFSRTSSDTKHTQRTGRVARSFTYEDGRLKVAVIINLYIKDTKDYNWLIKAQRRDASVIWVESVVEILEAEGVLEAEE